MLVIGSKIELIQKFKEELEEVFEVTDLGIMKYFLGMEVSQSSDSIFICQQKYIIDILTMFGMQDCKPVSTPISTGVKLGTDKEATKVDCNILYIYISLIGSLLYLIASIPNIIFDVSLPFKFIHSPKETHFTIVKRVLRYIKGTSMLGIFFPTSAKETLNLIGYSDSDWGGCIDNSRSTSGYLLSSGISLFNWSSRKQETTAQSTTEVEYTVVAYAVNQAIWLRKMLKDLGYEQTEATRIMCDNISAISISKNPVFHGKTMHMKITFHFVRDAQQSNEVVLVHYSSKNQLANIFTKSFPKERFKDLRQRIGVYHKNAKER